MMTIQTQPATTGFARVVEHITQAKSPSGFLAAVTLLGQNLCVSAFTAGVAVEIQRLQRHAEECELGSITTEILSQCLILAQRQTGETFQKRDRWALVAFCLILTNEGLPEMWDYGKIHEGGIGEILSQNTHFDFHQMIELVWDDEDEDDDEDLLA